MQGRDHRIRPLRRRATVLPLCAMSSAMHADPAWHSGRAGHKRLLHLAISATIGLGYITSETLLKSTFAASEYRCANHPRSIEFAIARQRPYAHFGDPNTMHTSEHVVHLGPQRARGVIGVGAGLLIPRLMRQDITSPAGMF
jgi:hypothetical protein